MASATSSEPLAPARHNGQAAASSPRIRTRSPVPSGRAALGALLVTLAALGAYAAQNRGAPAASYLVATRPLDAGSRLGAGDVVAVPIDLPAAQAQVAFTGLAGVEGAIVLAPLGAGDLLQRSALLLPSEGVPPEAPPRQELSFSVAVDRALGLALGRGELVDVVATYGTGDAAYSRVVARRIPVLSVDGDDGGGGLRGDARATITVAVDEPGRSLELAHASQVGVITLIRTTGTAGQPSGPDTYRAEASTARPDGAPAPSTPTPGRSAAGGSASPTTTVPTTPGSSDRTTDQSGSGG